jgi:predicted hydrolase (HD superfamily)
MALNRAEAWALLTEWTNSKSLLKHAEAVEIVMKAASHRYGGDDANEEQWGIAGLLHDADYDQWPETHPDKIVQWLRDKEEPALAHAIAAHYTKWGVPYEQPLEKALVACDELTGFIVACCLVRPEGVATLKPKSVKKKLKDKRFASTVERDEVHTGIELLEADLSEHIQFIIDALKPHAAILGIGPKA